MIGQPATFDTTKSGKGGVVLVTVGSDRHTVFKIDNQSTMGVAGSAHHVFFFSGHIKPRIFL
ncbi:MAG: hypothetical protein ACJAYG_001407 [Oceanicoccus sp.]|jgi:hypothetical protein